METGRFWRCPSFGVRMILYIAFASLVATVCHPAPPNSGFPLRQNVLVFAGNQSAILTAALCTALVFVVACISLAICLLKRRGNKLQNSREQVAESNAMAENQQVENLVYSTVNHSLSAAPTRTETPMGPDTDIVYADLKKY